MLCFDSLPIVAVDYNEIEDPDTEPFGVECLFYIEPEDDYIGGLLVPVAEPPVKEGQDASLETKSDWDSFVFDILTAKMKSNIANAHLDSILAILSKYNFKLNSSNGEEKAIPKTTTAIYNLLGMNGSLGDWKTERACVNRCCLLPHSATHCPVPSCNEVVSDEDVIFYHRK